MAKKILDKNNNPVVRDGKEVYKSSNPDAIVVKGVDLEKRTMSMRGSTEAVDRDGDIISLKGWNFDNYRKNPVILFGHDYGSVPIAGTTAITVGKVGVDFDIKYPTKGLYPFADMILGLYYEKIMNASSVGFMPYDHEEIEGKSEGVRFTAQELLELSKVGVPSNPEALQLSMINTKSFGDKVEPVCIDNFCYYLENNDTKSLDCLMPEEKVIDDIYNEIHCKEMKLEEKSGLMIPVSINFDSTKEVIEEDDSVISNVTIIGDEKEVAKSVKGIMSELVDEKTLAYRKAVSPFKSFDVTEIDVPPASFNYEIWSKFLDCEIKDIYQTPQFINTIDIGNYLSAFDEVMERDYELLDTRNFYGNGSEAPIRRAMITLNPEKQRDFVVSGNKYYKKKDTKEKIIVNFMPDWGGIDVTFITDSKGINNQKTIIKDAKQWVKINNYLKGWAFSVWGDFLDYKEADWDDVILLAKIKTPLLKSAKRFEANKELSDGRGLMFIGPPGTGKTYSGRTLMNDMKGTTFIWVSAKDMMYNGERSISIAYSLARELAPSIIFMEDMDSWIRDNVVDLMKIEMDGLVENKGVLTILTSNNPEKFPEALIDRPGRFHEILNFDYPDKVTREEMIMKWTGANSIHVKTLNILTHKTHNFSGAHIRELVNYALVISKEEDIDIEKALIKSLDKTLEQRELIATIQQSTKSINKSVAKAGAVLNKKNKALLKNASDMVLEVLENAGSVTNPDTEETDLKQLQKSNNAKKEVKTVYETILEQSDSTAVKDSKEKSGKEEAKYNTEDINNLASEISKLAELIKGN